MVTIADVAGAAGVSAATVDRALNGRSGVHTRTRSRVMSAAQRIGYVDLAVTPEKTRRRPVQLAFFVPGGTNTFMSNLGHTLQAVARAAPDVDLSLHRLDTYRPEALAAGLRQAAADADGIGVIALDHPIVRDAIRDLAAAGKRVLTLVSDISDVPRFAYVGIDNRAAGRLAGHLLGRFLRQPAGEVALFAGSLSYRGHEEREMGFRRICAEDFPGIVLLPTQEVEDDIDSAFTAARRVMARHPGLAGVYCIGGGVRGIARALQEPGRSNRPVFIGHELTEHTRRFLLSGLLDAVIDQDPVAEAQLSIDTLTRLVRGDLVPAPAMLRAHAIFRENIPDAGAINRNSGDNA